jgi:M6 family metalloprotease-like protein
MLLFSAAAIAKPLAVRKPNSESTQRAATERKPASSTPRLADRVRRLPLDLGPVKPVFERRQLERRSSVTRGGGVAETLVVKVAVLRIEFATDRMGDFTTGNGRMMRDGPDSVFIDPPPHDEDYFQAHMTAVDRYWSSMTYGNAKIEGTIFPRGQEFGAYVLSDMADYGPENENEFFSIEGLTRFFQDCLKAADADSGMVWNDYDVLFIVHAGSDWQNDILGNTPFDIPTFSITLSDSDVVVSDTGDTLTTGIVFPETSSQDGFSVALNGAIAHEMGHQFGLFDLYNIETFAPTVGFYDLMDSGNLTSVLIQNPVTLRETEVVGILPSALGAWSRWLVLFRFGINPKLVKEDIARARLRAIQSRATLVQPNSAKWFQLPISDSEYFLVENRVDDLDGKDASGNFKTALDQDDSTGVVLGPINEKDEISHNYDLLINPGVVIWHVDERQVLANFSQGRGINVFFEKRGVTIEEADGIVDIGTFEFPLGTDKETFHAGNNANFSPTTRPNSDSNLGSPSNISVLNIGPRDSTVVMDLQFSSKPRGWPMEVSPFGASGLASVMAGDADGDGLAEVVACGDSAVFVFRYDDGDGDGEVDFAGAWPQPAGGRTHGTPIFTPTMANLDLEPRLEILAATDSGDVYAWNDDGVAFAAADSGGLILSLSPDALAHSVVPADLNGDAQDELFLVTRACSLRAYTFSSGVLQPLFAPLYLPSVPADSGETFSPALAIGDLGDDGLDEGIVAFVDGDSLHVQSFDAERRRTLRRAILLPAGHGTKRVFLGLADLDRLPENNDLEIVIATDRGSVFALDRQGAALPGWPVTLLPNISGPPAFGDLDRDGMLEVVLASGGHRLDVLNYNGTAIPGYPVLVDLADYPNADRSIPPPVVADVDGDGGQDVVCGMIDFTVRAYNGAGKAVGGFPMVTGFPVQSAPAILDGNGDERLDLFVQSTDGLVYGRILSGFASGENPAWGMLGGGPSLHGSFDERRLPVLAGGGSDILQGPVTIFPNPAHASDSEITIRYTLGSDLAPATGVEISLYNVAGELVDRVEGTAFANTENVVRIPSQKLASGAYLCTLRARSGSREASHLEKFAVIR